MQSFINTRITGEPAPLNEVSTGSVEDLQLEMESILAAALADSSNVRVSHLNKDGKLVEVTRLYHDRVTGRLTYQKWTLV